MDLGSVTARGLLGRTADVQHLSQELAQRFGVRQALLVDHGSTAIRAALWALRLQGTRPLRAVGAPCNVWRGVYSGAGLSGCEQLHLLDVHPEHGVVAVPDGRTALDAVVAVDGYGRRAPVESLAAAGLAVIEDASLSQAPSRRPDGLLAADVCVMSLQSNKLLSCEEGGLVLTDREDLAELLQAAVCDGRSWLHGVDHEPVAAGFNGMMSAAVAAVLRTALAAHDAYLGRVAAGVASVSRLLGADGVAAWVEPELAGLGALFALPVLPTAGLPLHKAGMSAGEPPVGPDARQLAFLRQLPVQVVTPGSGWPAARHFASSHRLVPHWDLQSSGEQA